MARLNTQQKRLIVQRLATFYKPAEIQAELQEVFAVQVPLSTIMRYDPTTAQGGQELAQQWRHLFTETRARFVEDTSSIACAHRSYRLRRIQQLLDDASHRRNPMLVKDLLREAREEMKALELSGHFNLDDLDDQQLERIVRGDDPLRVIADSRKGSA